MTEAEWLTATDPTQMLEFLREKASDRKLRLYACACCRRLWHLISDQRVKMSLDTIERFADGQASDTERSVGRKVAQHGAEGRDVTDKPTSPKWQRRAASSVFWAGARDASEAALHAPDLVIQSLIWHAGGHQLCDSTSIKVVEQIVEAEIIRDIFGNPFLPLAFSTAWRTSTILALANGIYSERAFDRMPILADALIDAGCTNADLLDHCRGPGPHVRGCWAVDLVLGFS